MKLFRRIAALALAVAVVAMFGISASAASFRDMNIFGDFQAGAIFTGILTSKTITGTAEFIPNSDDNILQNQNIVNNYWVTNLNGGSENILVDFQTERIGNVVNHYSAALGENYNFTRATYTYNAYYIANGVVDCYLSAGPHTLIN